MRIGSWRLARQGNKYTEKILELLAQEIMDFDNDPMTWLETFLVATGW